MRPLAYRRILAQDEKQNRKGQTMPMVGGEQIKRKDDSSVWTRSLEVAGMQEV